MRQNSTLKKMISYLRVIDTLKRFLIMRHTITRARAQYAVYIRTCDTEIAGTVRT